MKCTLKIIPNTITLFRIILACIVNIYITKQFFNMNIVILISLLIFITDFIDGKIARNCGWTSNIGAVLDVSADLFYIVVSYIVVYNLKILPIWFLFIILFKFMEFIITSFFLNKCSYQESIFVFDFIGKIAVTFFYFIPITAFVSFHICKNAYVFITNICIFIIAGMSFISSIYRIRNCIETFKNKINMVSIDK